MARDSLGVGGLGTIEDGNYPADVSSNTINSWLSTSYPASNGAMVINESEAIALDSATLVQFIDVTSATSGKAPDYPPAALSPSKGGDAVATAPPTTVPDGAVVEITNASSQTVNFAGATGSLKLDDAIAFTGQISGLTGSDSLDLADISFGANTTATFSGNTNGGVLTVTDGTHTANIALVGNHLSSNWDLSSDGHRGTTVIDPVSSSNWQTLDVGAGGYVTGIDIAPDDTMVARTDTYGAYIWNGTKWHQLITATTMPAAFLAPTGQGVYEIQIAPNNSNILFMSYDGYVFKSTNKGATWKETSFAHVTENAGNAYKMNGQKMAIDPENPNVVYVGTPQNGLFVSTNGGATWQSVNAVPVSAKDSTGVFPGIAGIEFDPALGVIEGKTKTIFAASCGHGVYESTNGGASWSAIGGPRDVEYAAVSSTGVYYVVGNGNSLWSYKNGAWTKLLSDTSHGIATVAVDPFNPNEIVCQGISGDLDVSYNGGATWSGANSNIELISTDIPWLADAAKNLKTGHTGFLTIGGTVFDQLVPNKLWISDGIGIWNTTNLPTQNFATATIILNDQSVAIEQLVANGIIVPPGGDPVLASLDRPFFYIKNANAYPSTYGPVDNVNIVAGWSLDYASWVPSFVVGIADNWGIEESGYSTNGGQTWTAFATDPKGAGKSYIGGTIAASSPTNIIWAPAGGKDPYYTLNGGVTWNPITLPGVSNWSSFDSDYYYDTRTVTADRVLPNTFYLYYPGKGVFETKNGGTTWTKVFSGLISPYPNFNSKIESVPGEAGNLFFTGAHDSSFFSSVGFFKSTNGGATWKAIANVYDVSCFGFGAAATAGGYPAIYIVGYVDKVYGIWQSNDDARSWVRIGHFPDGSLSKIKTISGDPNHYGEVYVGFSGDGYAYLPATSTTGRAVASASNTNQTVTETGKAVTLSGSSDTVGVTGDNNAIQLSGSSDNVTITGNGNDIAVTGSGNSIAVGASTGGNLVKLGSGSVTLAFSGGNNTVIATRTTHLAADSVTGAGDDTLALIASGRSFDLTKLSHFSGFSLITLSGSDDTLILTDADLAVLRTSGSGDTIILGNGIDSIGYTSVNQSTHTSHDIIIGFNANQDSIDFSAISGLNSNSQKVVVNFLSSTPSIVAGHTIDVVTSGGNTIVFANATSSNQSISASFEGMEIKLLGVGLHSADFILHH